ncbi:MAG: hypothetical protein IPK02_16495 [Candidatus Accumulibacter sp.]|uniref:Competence protein CoiA-like N-terminal domain-containing protein n=1 Tax=Candidatus Accumulibacter affinis TaxID=2954384 RepID=A0A935T9B5_9PROT|nr:hypothetical protein [Candidatus Accumulibacter affinis]
MTALILPFAKRLSDQRLVSPDEVPRGLACNCVCPGCEHPVLARQGTEREWHFAHSKGDPCSDGYEVSVHELAKQLIRDRKELLLPVLEAVVSAKDAFGNVLVETEICSESLAVPLDDCVTGRSRQEVTPDICGTLNGKEILVEITVFHRLMPKKQERLIETGLPSFEIDLSAFKSKQATRELVADAIFSETGNRKWIYHPRIAAVEAELQRKLDQKLAEARERWDAAEGERKERETQCEKSKEALALRNKWALRQFSSPHWPASSAVFSATMDWRASFPSPDLYMPARKALSERLNLSEEIVESVLGTITRRGQLASTTPEDLSEQWALKLGCSVSDVVLYFREAGYIFA